MTLINFENLINNIKTDWKTVLINIYKKKEMLELADNIEDMYQDLEEYFNIFPPPEQIFNAFNFFNFSNLKVVIIGQDPYHGEGQAMGLSFSVPKGIKPPPSLVNIYKELKMEFDDYIIPKHGDLTKWAQQGVLLLNASLTVREKKANSHELFWKKTGFTDDIIKYISNNSKGIIFILWGNFARNKKKLINSKHYIIEGAHPSPLSQKLWFGCGHFKNANDILEANNKEVIDWQI